MKQELLRALACLKKGKTLLYPTDTVWGIGCDATDSKAVAEIFKIKQRDESKSLVILVDGIQMLKDYISNIPVGLNELLEGSQRPTSIIYQDPKGLASNVIAADNTVAIRMVQNDFCRELIRQFGKPIVSTSANISGRPTPGSFSEIEAPILEAVDYVVNLQRDAVNTTPSRILKLNADGEIVVIRD